LEKQLKKDNNQVHSHKNKIIQEIKKELPVFEKKVVNMPQFSEKYLKEKDEENKPRIMEGYLASLLNLSDKLPFTPLKAEMSFTVDSNTYIKILKEVERIRLGEEAEPELLNIDPTFDVQIGKILVTFILQED